MNQKACLNCNNESEAHYCPVCGQSKAVKVSSVWHFINEILEVIYDLDSKIWKSVLPLIFKPGKLTTEYIAGRRVKYLPPFRIYLILSIFFSW
jgi:RNA polymerase subunit RPABC4/transcription elongation factor Spt4